MTNVVSREQKIESIESILLMHAKDFAGFQVTTHYSGLQGPHVSIKTPQYEGDVTVEFSGSIVRFDIEGFRQRFADTSAFFNFFKRTLQAPSPACVSLAAALHGKTAGVCVVAVHNKIPYMFTEKEGMNNMFEASFNNQKTLMALTDIISIFS